MIHNLKGIQMCLIERLNNPNDLSLSLRLSLSLNHIYVMATLSMDVQCSFFLFILFLVLLTIKMDITKRNQHFQSLTLMSWFVMRKIK